MDNTTSPAPPLVDLLLQEQLQITAIERFAQRYESAVEPQLAGHYRELIPLSRPGPDEQYAFEVDLDACSGCKSCVAACHNLNGLDEGEQWREVGVLHGQSNQTAILQHVTSACHHCLDPACLTGCPVLAYEKDASTGIVRHLDDQCIGCQYCMFMCPYDVPQYNHEKGIVRKCDMCQERLAVGEAPACVQACPNRAIRIQVVSREQVFEESETNQFLPTAPEPRITYPTTVYKSQKALPRNLLPADYYSANRQPTHLALVFMLVLTQLSVGTFAVGQVLVSGPWANPLMLTSIRPANALAGLTVGLLGMHAAIFHLGRPRYAYRSLLGLRTSWLSREILAFGAFACCAMATAALVGLAGPRPQLTGLADRCGLLAATVGVVAVLCSIMIYVKTGRPYWNLHRTGTTFLLSCVVLGLPLALLVSILAGFRSPDLSAAAIMHSYGRAICKWLLLATTFKLAGEASVLMWLRSRQHTPLKRTALLLTGEMSMTWLLRIFFGVMGGVLLPLILLFGNSLVARNGGYQPLFLGFVVLLIALLLLVGELLERYLFFAVSVAPKMPGGPGT